MFEPKGKCLDWVTHLCELYTVGLVWPEEGGQYNAEGGHWSKSFEAATNAPIVTRDRDRRNSKR